MRLNKQNKYFSLFNPKNLLRHMRYISIKTKNDVLGKARLGPKDSLDVFGNL